MGDLQICHGSTQGAFRFLTDYVLKHIILIYYRLILLALQDLTDGIPDLGV